MIYTWWVFHIGLFVLMVSRRKVKFNTWDLSPILKVSYRPYGRLHFSDQKGKAMGTTIATTFFDVKHTPSGEIARINRALLKNNIGPLILFTSSCSLRLHARKSITKHHQIPFNSHKSPIKSHQTPVFSGLPAYSNPRFSGASSHLHILHVPDLESGGFHFLLHCSPWPSTARQATLWFSRHCGCFSHVNTM